MKRAKIPLTLVSRGVDYRKYISMFGIKPGETVQLNDFILGSSTAIPGKTFGDVLIVVAERRRATNMRSSTSDAMRQELFVTDGRSYAWVDSMFMKRVE